MKTNNIQKTIPLSVFADAAVTFFKCKPEDIGIEMMTENHEALVQFKNASYKISTREKLRDDIEDMLTHADRAQSINLSIWIQVTRNTMTIGRFLPNVVRNLEDIQQARILRLALVLNAHSEDQYETFWRTLNSIDRTGVMLANAIVSAREAYPGDGLLEDITDMMILNGITVYNVFEGGIFQELYADDDQNTHPEFYIYSVEGTVNE